MSLSYTATAIVGKVSDLKINFAVNTPAMNESYYNLRHAEKGKIVFSQYTSTKFKGLIDESKKEIGDDTYSYDIDTIASSNV